MLWTLLIGINSGAFLAGALLWANTAGGAEFGAYAGASLVGLAMGAGNMWLWHQISHAVTGRMMNYPTAIQERYLRPLYVSAVLWILVATILGYWLTTWIAVLVSAK